MKYGEVIADKLSAARRTVRFIGICRCVGIRKSTALEAIFNNGTERWLVTYHGTDAVLTATANTSDQASTLLLLSLSLLGVLTYRCQLLRKSA